MMKLSRPPYITLNSKYSVVMMSFPVLGSEASFIIEVQQLERYPVDLYYLVDVSASMQDNLDRLKTVGLALSHQMKEHSSDFRVGFGSFVDKPVSPYIDVHPSKLVNPCR